MVENIEKVQKIKIKFLNRLYQNESNEISFEFETVRVISPEGMTRLNLADNIVLQIAMTNDTRIKSSLKRSLLYGLLFKKNSSLTMIEEGQSLIAPSTDLRRQAAKYHGHLSFNENNNSGMIPPPPGIEYFCDLKGRHSIPEISQIIMLIISTLKLLKSEETLGHLFRIKSRSSILNKLFFRGKDLSDFYAATATTFDEMEDLISKLESCGAKHCPPNTVNGNGCPVIRYVRMLTVTILENRNQAQEMEQVRYEFQFPVYYEIVYRISPDRSPHDIFELTRLNCGLTPEKRDLLEEHGFTIHEFSYDE